MARSRRAVLRVLASISDGAEPDWASVETGVTPTDRQELAALKAIAGVAELHRSYADPKPEPLQASPRPSWNGFTIFEQLGEGSSGTVFRASQPNLDRDVALKLFKPTGGGAAAGGRMLAEARALARVRHEHVVQVHGAESADGCVGLWMELVRGQSFEELVGRQGTMAAREAALVGSDVCRALAAVHRAGLVHGDVKAQNVMREDGGRVVLMDFGSGRLREASQSTSPTGTPLYLAPEVLGGGPPSVAGDVYAVGVLLFFLMTGEYPVTGRSVRDLVAAHRAGRRHYLQALRPDCPDAFAEVVERALAPDPTARFQSAAEMQRALARVMTEAVPVRWYGRWGRLAAIAAALAITGAAAYGITIWPADGGPPYTSVAVIPFDVLPEVSEEQRFLEGISDDVTMQLARMPGLRLVAGTSARRYGGPGRRDGQLHASVEEIGRELNVAAVVTGSVRVRGPEIRVLAELIDTKTSHQIWSDTFVGASDHIDALQGRVAVGIARAFTGQLTQAQEQAIARMPMDSAALQLYLRGAYLASKRTPADLLAGIDFLERARAVQEHPTVYAGLAIAYVFAGLYEAIEQERAYGLAERAALAALALDPAHAEAHTALGEVYQREWNFLSAERAYRRAVEVNPNYATARQWYALYLAQAARFEEARREIDYAVSLDPLAIAIRTARGVVLYHARDFDGAIRQHLEVLAAEAAFTSAAFSLAEAYVMTREYDAALEALARSSGPAQPIEPVRALQAYIHAARGDRGAALQLLRDIEAQPNRRMLGEMDVAAAYDLLGLSTEAGNAIERAVKSKDMNLRLAAVEPRWDRLRATPSFSLVGESLNLSIGDAR